MNEPTAVTPAPAVADDPLEILRAHLPANLQQQAVPAAESSLTEAPAEESAQVDAGALALAHLMDQQKVKFFQQGLDMTEAEALQYVQARNNAEAGDAEALLEEVKLVKGAQTRSQEKSQEDREKELKEVDVIPPGQGAAETENVFPTDPAGVESAFMAGFGK